MNSDAGGRAIQIGRFVGDPVVLNLGVASANTQLVAYKKYRLWASMNAFFKFGVDSTVAATTSSNPLTAGLDALHATDAVNFFIAGVVASGTGVLYISEIEAHTS